MNRHFEVEAYIYLYKADRGRHSFITTGYRPHIYFGYSDPSNPNFSSDCIISLIHKDKLFPGERAIVLISVLKYSHLKGLLAENVKIKIKEAGRFIGDGVITKEIGEVRTPAN
jgi:translation elongation factor EF-Tu-like GTPase